MHVETSFVRNLGDLIRARRRSGLVHEGKSYTMNMYADEKSDEGIRPEKRLNKRGVPLAEAVEERTSPEGNGGRTAAARTLSRGAASNGLAAVRQTAQRSKQTRFTALLHHITIDLLTESFFALERNAAPGIDGVTWRAYQENRDCQNFCVRTGFVMRV
jgi:hypothetical protein